METRRRQCGSLRRDRRVFIKRKVTLRHEFIGLVGGGLGRGIPLSHLDVCIHISVSMAALGGIVVAGSDFEGRL